MACAEGTALTDRMAAAAQPADRRALLPLLTRLVSVMARVHGLGVIHRDLKPANILIDRHDAVTVLDWGLACRLPDSAVETPITDEKTRHGARLGTPGYMSPEQAAGLPADARADVWALGVLLWEALAGEPAYPGDRAPDIIARILRGPPPMAPIGHAGRRVVAVVRAALSELSQRPRDASALHAALQEALTPRRHWRTAAWALPAAAALLAGPALLPEPPAEPAPAAVETPAHIVETLSRNAIHAAREGRRYRSELLAADALDAGGPDHLRGLLLSPTPRPALEFTISRPVCEIGEQISPDGALIACANTGHTIGIGIGEDGLVERWQKDVEIHQLEFQGNGVVLGQVPAQETMVQLSREHGGPLGTSHNMASGVLVQSRHPDILMRLEGADRKREIALPDGQSYQHDHAPPPCVTVRAMVLSDTSELYACTGVLLRIDGDSRAELARWEYPDPTWRVSRLVVSMDEQHAALLMANGHYATIPLGGEASWSATPIIRAGSIAISHTGTHLAMGTFTDTIVWEIGSEAPPLLLPGQGQQVIFDAQDRLITMGIRQIQRWRVPELEHWSVGARIRGLTWSGAGLLVQRNDGAVIRWPDKTMIAERDVRVVAADPRHDRVAFSLRGGRVRVSGGRTVDVGEECWGLVWLDDTTLLCAPNAPGPLLINTDTGDVDHRLGLPGSTWFTATAQDGMAALLEWSGTIWTTRDQAPLVRSSTHPWTNVLALSPQQDTVAMGGSWGVALLSLADGTIRKRLETEYRVGRVAWSPDGRWLAVTTYEGSLYLYRDEELVAFQILESIQATSIVFSPDGTQLALGYSTGRIQHLDLTTLDRPTDALTDGARAAWGAR